MEEMEETRGERKTVVYSSEPGAARSVQVRRLSQALGSCFWTSLCSVLWLVNDVCLLYTEL